MFLIIPGSTGHKTAAHMDFLLRSPACALEAGNASGASEALLIQPVILPEGFYLPNILSEGRTVPHGHPVCGSSHTSFLPCLYPTLPLHGSVHNPSNSYFLRTSWYPTPMPEKHHAPALYPAVRNPISPRSKFLFFQQLNVFFQSTYHIES